MSLQLLSLIGKIYFRPDSEEEMYSKSILYTLLFMHAFHFHKFAKINLFTKIEGLETEVLVLPNHRGKTIYQHHRQNMKIKIHKNRKVQFALHCCSKHYLFQKLYKVTDMYKTV